MDLVDRIETTRFLGSEFLVWLWFKTDLFEGHLDVDGVGACDVWLDAPLDLAPLADQNERVSIKGVLPTSSKEATEALRRGKVPTKVRIVIAQGTSEYSAMFNAATFALSSVKLPAVLSETEYEADEMFIERMRLIDELYELVEGLYREFLQMRLKPVWFATLVPAIQGWIKGKSDFSEKDYKAALKKARA